MAADIITTVDLTPQFWAIVGVAAGVATFLATAAAVLVSVWWRILDRREAEWVFTDARSEWMGPDSYGSGAVSPRAWMSLTNAGDGTAFRVSVTGSWCQPKLYGDLLTGSASRSSYQPQLELKPALGPGSEVTLRVECDPRLWEVAEIHVRWRRSPTWRQRRSRRYNSVRLSELAPTPTFRPTIYASEPDQVPIRDPQLPPLTDEETAALRGRGALDRLRQARRRRRDRAR